MSAIEIGELLKFPGMGPELYQLIHKFPALQLKAFVLPISSAYLNIEVEVRAMFNWD